MSLILVIMNVNHFMQDTVNEGTQKTTNDVTNLHIIEPNSKCVYTGKIFTLQHLENEWFTLVVIFPLVKNYQLM